MNLRKAREDKKKKKKSYKLACGFVFSEDSHQPADPSSLISLRCSPADGLGPWLPTECLVKAIIGLRRCAG